MSKILEEDSRERKIRDPRVKNLGEFHSISSKKGVHDGGAGEPGEVRDSKDGGCFGVGSAY